MRLLAAETDAAVRRLADAGNEDAKYELAVRGLAFHAEQHKRNVKVIPKVREVSYWCGGKMVIV